MKKQTSFFAVSVLCFSLCACGNSNEQYQPTATRKETFVAETNGETIVETIISVTEAPVAPATETPRVIGPEQIEGNAVTIEKVSVEFLDELPIDIKSSTTYSVSGFKDEFVLNKSQVYAEIHFTITNKTTGEMKIADIHDDFLVELIYDNRFVYSPDNDSWCFFKAGAQTAVVSDMAGIGSVTLQPLTTKDVTVYMPCAKEVSTELGKYLIVVFTSNYSGYENLEFIIR